MRSRQIEAAALAIVFVLVALAALVATVRSRGPAADEAAAGVEPGRAEPAAVEPGRGAAVFEAECAACHPRAREVPASARYSRSGGREALIDLLLGGAVAGDEGAHPDFAHLDDADLAAVASHLLAEWSGDGAPSEAGPPIESEEVAARRGQGPG